MGNKNIAGIDVDKKALHVAFRDGDSVKIEEFPNDLHGVEELVAFLKAISVELVVLESTGSYWIKLSEALSASNIGCVVLNPADVKRSGVHKSDDRDAVWLLHVGEIGVFQTSYVPPGDVRRLRDIVRARFKAADRVASAKQRIINLLNARGVRLPRGYGMNSQAIRIILKNAVKRGEYEAVEDALKAFFRDVVTALDEADLMLLSLYLTELETLESLLGKYDELIRVYAEPYMEKIELLMTVPGIGFLTAVSLLAEIGTVSRFPSPANLASYAGLVPRLNESGGKKKSAPLTKRSNPWMRRIMFLVGRAAVRSNSKLIREFYTRLRRRGKHYLTAVVAVARKILTIIWRMLVERKPWAEKVKEKPYVKRPVEIKNIDKEEVLERLVNLLLRDT